MLAIGSIARGTQRDAGLFNVWPMKITENWGKANSDPKRWRTDPSASTTTGSGTRARVTRAIRTPRPSSRLTGLGLSPIRSAQGPNKQRLGGALEHADSSRSFAPQKTQKCVCVLRSPWRGDSPVKTTPSFEHSFYKTRAAAGIKTHAVLQGRPLCQFGSNKTRSNWKCLDSDIADVAFGTNKTVDPSSYSQLAAHVYQYAGRWAPSPCNVPRLASAWAGSITIDRPGAQQWAVGSGQWAVCGVWCGPSYHGVCTQRG